MSIPYQQVMRTETAIADTVINEMKARDHKYIPLNFIKGTLPYYHVDNIDFLEDTSDGSLTTHTLNCIAHQQHLLKSSDIMELDLPKHCTTKRSQPNIFGNLENWAFKGRFKINSTYKKNLIIAATDINVKSWAIGKAVKFLYSPMKQHSNMKPRKFLFDFQMH